MKKYNADNRVEVPPTQPKSDLIQLYESIDARFKALEKAVLNLANENIKLKRRIMGID